MLQQFILTLLSQWDPPGRQSLTETKNHFLQIIFPRTIFPTVTTLVYSPSFVFSFRCTNSSPKHDIDDNHLIETKIYFLQICFTWTVFPTVLSSVHRIISILIRLANSSPQHDIICSIQSWNSLKRNTLYNTPHCNFLHNSRRKNQNQYTP